MAQLTTIRYGEWVSLLNTKGICRYSLSALNRSEIGLYFAIHLWLKKMERRIECDLDYIRNWSLMLVLKIMLKTMVAVSKRDNAY